MVAFLFLFAPTVVLIAVLILQRFQPGPDGDPGILIERVAERGRVEPRFGASRSTPAEMADGAAG